MSDPLDVDAAEARANAATPGPWVRGDRWHVAAVMPELFGEGKCSACARHGEPTWVGRRYINGKRMLAHVHEAAKNWYECGIVAVRDSGPISVVVETDEYGLLDPADAEFIAHARTDVPALIARVRELEDERVDTEWGKVIATKVRANCTLDWDVMQKGGDAIIYAVADWIENPPDWVKAQWEPVPTGSEGKE